ncbi:MAG: FAD-dependent oxidoreductase [Candidatus Limnocylindria bacterium]
MRTGRHRALARALAVITLLGLGGCGEGATAPDATTVVVYGATPAGIMAAIAAAEEGAHVRLIEPTDHVGGMVTSGLGATDTEHPGLIGGLAQRFFVRIGAASGQPEGVLGLRHEPHVAAEVFDEMLDEAGLSVETGRRLESVEMDGPSLTAMKLDNGDRIEGARFIDATYEGDLMAAAEVPYRIGREASDEYGESLGVEVADDKVQAYTYRLCVTDQADNRIPIQPPDTYDRAAFVPVLDHLGDNLESVISRVEIPGGKWDLNNRDPISTDAVGLGWEWAEATADERAELADEHRDHVAGLLSFLATDRAVPEPVRREASTLGLCADEWDDNGGWPPQLYVREARRMVGDYVLSQWDLENDPIKSEPIALGTYRVDSHAVDRIDGQLEGVLNLRVGPYAIPYRSIIPSATDATNLLVPVALSATHVAFSSLRMEPTWMATGEAAGVAAALPADGVQQVNRAMLDERLRERGAMLDPPVP